MTFAKRAVQFVNRVVAKQANLVFRRVLASGPMRTDPAAETVLYSVLDHKNINPYLLAVKSFLRYYDRVRVVVQNDGTLSPADLRQLAGHLPGIELLDRAGTIDFLRPYAADALPFLTDFERQMHFFILFKLLPILLRYQGQKVILLDSDIIFLKRPSLVIDWIEHGRNYCFHSDGGNGLTGPFRAMGFEFPHVDVNDFNAGFFGFVHTIPMGLVTRVLTRVYEYDPRLLKHWEIEQAIWSVLLNAHEHPLNLDRVGADYVGGGRTSLARLNQRAVLAHFVGSMRYHTLRYPRLGYGIIDELIGDRRGPGFEHSPTAGRVR